MPGPHLTVPRTKEWIELTEAEVDLSAEGLSPLAEWMPTRERQADHV